MSAEADFLVVVTIVATDPNIRATKQRFEAVASKIEEALSSAGGPLGQLPGTFSVVVADG